MLPVGGSASLHLYFKNVSTEQQKPVQKVVPTPPKKTLAEIAQVIITLLDSRQLIEMQLQEYLQEARITYFETYSPQALIVKDIWNLILKYYGECRDFINAFDISKYKLFQRVPRSLMELAFQANHLSLIDKEKAIKILIEAGGDIHRPISTKLPNAITLKEWYLLHKAPYQSPLLLLRPEYRTPESRLLELNRSIPHNLTLFYEYRCIQYGFIPHDQRVHQNVELALTRHLDCSTNSPLNSSDPSNSYVCNSGGVYTIAQLIAYLTKHLLDEHMLLTQSMIGSFENQASIFFHIFFNVDISTPQKQEKVHAILSTIFSKHNKAFVLEEDRLILRIEYWDLPGASHFHTRYTYKFEFEISCRRKDFATIQQYALLHPSLKPEFQKPAPSSTHTSDSNDCTIA